jgi:hypothetical protein
MRFEARDLKGYVDHVKAADLVVGRPYFRVCFIDKDMVIPGLEAVVFIGRNLHPDGPGLYYQDAASFLSGARFEPAELEPFPKADVAGHAHFTFAIGDQWIDVYPDREAAGVVDFDGALESLMHCSLRHRAWDGTLRPIPARDDE